MGNETEDTIYPPGWLVRRSSTLKMFLLLSFLHGVEWSMFFLVLWVYLKEIVSNESTAKLFYATISTSYLFVTIVFMPVVGIFIDKTRRIKETLVIGNILIILGNLSFSVSYSPYFLLAGRIFAGLGGSTICAFSAELARSFNKSDVIQKISITSSAYILGFVLGPCFGFAFTNVDVTITNGLRLTYGNSASLFLALCFIILTVLIPRFLFNVSLEFDLKQAVSENLNTEKIPLLENATPKTSKTISSKFSFICDISLLTMYSLSTLYQSSLVLFDMWIPLIITDVLNWKPLEVNLMFLGLSVLTFLFITLSNKTNISANIFIYILFASIVLSCFLSWLLYGLKHLQNVAYSIACIIIFDVIYALSAFVCTTVYPTSVANMVSSSNQALAESLRLAMGRIASCIALMTAPYLFRYIFAFSVFISLFYIGCLVMVIVRWRYILESIR